MIILTITMMRRSIYAMEIDMIHITPTGNYARMLAKLVTYRKRVTYRLSSGQGAAFDRAAFHSVIRLLRQARTGECPGIEKPSIPTGAA